MVQHLDQLINQSDLMKDPTMLFKTGTIAVSRKAQRSIGHQENTVSLFSNNLQNVYN